MVRDKKSRALDMMVVASVVAGVGYIALGKVVSLLSGGQVTTRSVLILLTTQYPVIPLTSIATCVVLMCWVFRCVDSPLWKWLPPFACIPVKTPLGKRAVVLLAALGSIVGLIGLVRTMLQSSH